MTENWLDELERWSPSLKVVQYYGSQEERKEMRMGWRNGDLDDVDVLLTTYNLICNTPEERKLFRVMPLNYVVFDEAHMLKNMSSVRYENLVRINVCINYICVCKDARKLSCNKISICF